MNLTHLIKSKKKLLSPSAGAALLAARLSVLFQNKIKSFLISSAAELPLKDSDKVRLLGRLFEKIMADFPKMTLPEFQEILKRVYLKSKEQTKQNAKKTVKKDDFDFSQIDRDALRILAEFASKSIAEWYKMFHKPNVAEVLISTLEKYFQDGMTDAQLIKLLETQLSELASLMKKNYFQIVADHWTLKLAQYGAVAGYEEAGVQYAQVVAMIDSKTSNICRVMDGKIIPVAEMKKTIQDALSADSLPKMKQAHKMFSNKQFEQVLANIQSPTSSQFVRAGAVLPPFHFGCRTRTVAFFPPPGWKYT